MSAYTSSRSITSRIKLRIKLGNQGIITQDVEKIDMRAILMFCLFRCLSRTIFLLLKLGLFRLSPSFFIHLLLTIAYAITVNEKAMRNAATALTA